MSLISQFYRMVEIFTGRHRLDWIDEHVAVGSDRVSPGTLEKMNVSAVLSVGAKLRKGAGKAATKFVEVKDKQAPDLKQIDEALEWMIERLEAGSNVLIHCRAGMGRSVTVAACYLMRTKGISAQEAVATIRKVHPQAAPTRAQIDFLRRFEQQSLRERRG
ncbi:MAG: dual specificity protein phosphatase [Thermoprotei archaeon]